MPGRETTIPSIPNDNATFDEEPGAAKAVLHRDIEASLPNLRRYARSLTRDTVAADDLVQECVARALAKLHLWRAGTDMRAWLFTILHNQYVSQLRRATCEGTTIEWGDCAPALTCAPQQIERLELRDLERAIMSPGGHIGLHSHQGDPTIVYLLSGVLTNHHDDGTTEEFGPGQVFAEFGPRAHWVEKGFSPVTFIVANIHRRE